MQPLWNGHLTHTGDTTYVENLSIRKYTSHVLLTDTSCFLAGNALGCEVKQNLEYFLAYAWFRITGLEYVN